MTLLREDLDYTIQLPSFEGPLDLLLRLIEREELDITTIALAQVADTYLAHVKAMQEPDPASVSAFLVIAAKLLLIKSRALLPRPPAPRGPDDPPDEGEELARQLRDYQRFKQAAQQLRSWQEEGRRMFLRSGMPPLPTVAPEPLDVSLTTLIAAFQRRMQLLLPIEDEIVPLPAPKVITVREMAERIQQRLQRQEWFSFEDLLSLQVSRIEIVVALWTILELLKRRVIVVEQQDLFGPIAIGRRNDVIASEFFTLLTDEGS